MYLSNAQRRDGSYKVASGRAQSHYTYIESASVCLVKQHAIPCIPCPHPPTYTVYRRCPGVSSLLDALAAANGLDLEADLAELVRINEETAIEDERGLVHALVDLLPVDLLELLPLGGDDDSLSALAGLEGGGADGNLLLD